MKMKDSGVEWIEEIPEEWKVEKISQLFQQRNVKVSDFDYPPLSVTKNGIVPQLESAAKSDDHTNRKLVKKNDFVINSRSDRKMSSGVSNLDGSVSLINLVMSYNHEKLNSRFVNYMMKNYGFAEEFYRWGTGIVADLWSTNWERGKNIQLPVPKIVEQQKIADFLDSKIALIDQIIADTKRSIEELKSYKQSLITETVTKGLDPNVPMKDSGVEWIGKIPEGWENVPLRYLGQLQNGISKGGDFFGSGYPFVNYGDVYKNDIVEASGLIQSTATEQENYSVKRGDVFFTRTSETIDEVGISSVALEDIGNATFAGFLIRFRPSTNKLLPEYSKYYFTSFNIRQHFTGMMNMVIRASLGQELLKSLPVFIPTKTEQKRIVNFLDEKLKNIQEQIQYKINIISEYESYRKSLIYEYVTGKKQVK